MKRKSSNHFRKVSYKTLVDLSSHACFVERQELEERRSQLESQRIQEVTVFCVCVFV